MPTDAEIGKWVQSQGQTRVASASKVAQQTGGHSDSDIGHWVLSQSHAAVGAPKPAVKPTTTTGASVAGAPTRSAPAPAPPRPAAPQPQVIGRSTITGRPVEGGASQLARATAAPGPSGFLANLGHDLVGVATGLPSAGVLLAKNLAVPFVTPFSPSYPAGVMKEDVQLGHLVWSDLSQRYGPAASALVHGDPVGAGRALAHSFYAHPGLMALDVGGASAVAGKLVGVGGRLAARVAPESAAGRVGARLGNRAITPGAPRYREPKVYTDPISPGTAHEATSTVTRSRRPYSANPLTRELIQKPAGRALGRAGRSLERHAEGTPRVYQPLLRRVTQEGKFDAAARRAAQDVRMGGEDRLAAELQRIGGAYQETIRSLKPIKGKGQVAEHLQAVPHEADVVHLHLRGIFDQPGMRPTVARDTMVQTMRENITQAKARGERTAEAEQNLARFEAIPERYLHLDTAPAHVRAAVVEGRKLIDEGQRRAVESKLVTPETARTSAERAVNVLLGRGKWDPVTERILTPAGFKAGPEARYLTDVPAAKMGSVPAGKSVGRFTKERVRQSHGRLISRGNVVTSPNLPLFQARRVLAHEQLGENVANLIARTAYRHGPEVARGPKALQMLRANPDRVHLVSVRAVQHALDDLEQVPEHGGVDANVLDRVLNTTPDEAAVRANPKDFIAIPKAAVEEWRTAMQSPDRMLRGYDSVLSAWKSGILAFTPRFYVNNLVSNAALYGLAAGPDIKSMIQAARKGSAFRKEGVIPERVAGSTIAREAGARALQLREGPLAAAQRWADRGFALNQRLESFWRRALYIHKAKGSLRDEGGKFRHLSQEEIADAVRKMPPQLVEESIRTVNDFLGDYRRFSRFERNAVKRVVPFYSWLRFIGTLTVALPFRSPLRAEALAALSKANDLENPGDFMRPLYNRGRINLPGGLAMRTTGLNPFSTVTEPIAAVTGQGSKVTGLARALTSGGAGPLAQLAIGEVTGRDPFTGRDYSAPPGYQGSFASYGQDAQRLNPATGLLETVHPSPGLGEQLLRQVPFMGAARQLLAGSQTPYDVTPTWDLIQHRFGGGPPAADLFRPSALTGRATGPIPYVSTLASLLGAPVQQVNPAAEQANYLRQQALAAVARANTIKQRAKLGARVGG